MDQIGRYQIEREIGRGAMGVVYAGFDPMLKRRVAVKTVLPSNAFAGQSWEMLTRRLAREAQAAGVLNHPNIVAVYDVVETNGAFSVVMEFVDGKSLAEAVPSGSLPPTEFTLRILKECAAALDHAHSRGVIHRDVKPANIMIDASGTAKIADFGIAKLLEATTDLSRGFTLGTLEYMSPEQLNAKPLDGRSDQYALAVVAYRLLTGWRIYDVDTFGAWCNMVSTQPPTPATQRNPSLPRAVDAVFERGMAKRPDERYVSCSEFVGALTPALSQPVPPPPPRPAVEPGEGPSRRKAFIFSGVAALLAGGIVVYWASRPPAPPDAAAQTSRPAGTTKVNPKDGLTYVWIPPGSFMMGCSPGDNECYEGEKPAHQVTLSKGFWMGQTEVTQEAYQRLIGANPSEFKGNKLPVERVFWNEAKAFCEAAGMRLPTETEWEYAARAGSAAARYGDLDAVAWYASNSGDKTHEVGQKQPNGFGLYDMLGNVWEWVADWYANYPRGSATDPHGPSSGQARVKRGGSWLDDPRFVRVSYRGTSSLADGFLKFGLRCARE